MTTSKRDTKREALESSLRRFLADVERQPRLPEAPVTSPKTRSRVVVGR